MECIEYRYIQGEKGLRAAVQLVSTKKYYNFISKSWEEKLTEPCYKEMLELTDDNLYNGNYDLFDFMKLYKDRVEDGLYVTASAELSIAPGALYSIHIFQGDKLISTTTRNKGSSKRFIELINEVQKRIGYPLSKRISEPNAVKIGAFINDVITELIPCGASTLSSKIFYKIFLPKGEKDLIVSPVNCKNPNGLEAVSVEKVPEPECEPAGTEETVEEPAQEKKNNTCIPCPVSYIMTSKSNTSFGIALNDRVSQDSYVNIDMYEKPSQLERASDRTVYDSGLVIKLAEYLAKDDAGMGGDVSGRDLALRYLKTESNLNDDANWDKFCV